jgi:hypothetical protein
MKLLAVSNVFWITATLASVGCLVSLAALQFSGYPVSREWDAQLNALLDRHEPVLFGHTCKLGGVAVWISNWPYAYGFSWPLGIFIKELPKWNGKAATRNR